MKKIYLILITVSLNVAFCSCTAEDISDVKNNTILANDCCGEDGDIPPPPPPPPIDTGLKG